MDAILSDLRLALRALRKSPAFTLVCVFTIGLAMMLCTTVLSVLNAYLYNELPYPAAARLYSVRYGTPGQDQPRGMEKLDWSSLNDVIEYPIAWDLDMFYVLGGENADARPGAWVTPGFVEGLGIRPAIGRGLDQASFERGAANVALISDRFWRSRFNGNAAAIGQQFTAYVSDRPEEAERFTVVGVLPANFWHLNPYTDILVPLRAPTHPYLVRLRENVSPDQAAARITAMVRAGASQLPEGWSATLASTHGLYVASVRPMLTSVAVAAALVLLVGCANVAGLQLLRAARRSREIAVRSALGATTGAIARLLFAEAFVLGSIATVFAVGSTALVLSSLAPVIQTQLGRPAPGGSSALAVDATILGWSLLAGLLTVFLCALVPLAVARRQSVRAAIQGGSRASTEGRRSRAVRAGLVAIELAASVTLVCGAALMTRTVASLLETDLGIESGNVLTASLTLRQSRYPDEASRLAVFDRIQAGLDRMPGAASAALMSSWPLQQPLVQQVDTDRGASRSSERAAVHVVSERYFETLAIALTEGRVFSPIDRVGSEPVAVVSETFARRAWPDAIAVGRRVFLPDQAGGGRPDATGRLVVGVVRDVRQDPSDQDRADIYVPFRQAAARFAFVLVRTPGTADQWLAPMRAMFREVDPEISLARVRSLQSLVDEMRARPQFLAWLLASFAAMAGLVAIVGLYGSMAYAVRQREREIAVRMAIGATRAHVTALFLRDGTKIVLAGLALGLAGARAAGGLLESQLFGVTPDDPLTLAVATALLGACALFAAWWPARRAASTDPAVALRVE